jgi:hypothetical protein
MGVCVDDRCNMADHTAAKLNSSGWRISKVLTSRSTEKMVMAVVKEGGCNFNRPDVSRSYRSGKCLVQWPEDYKQP